MWRNYLTVGLRALARNRTYTFINIFGLAVGLAASLLLFLYVRYETSYDQWLPDHERVFQVQTEAAGTESEEPQRFQITSFAAAEAIRRDFPQIDRAVWALPERATTMQDGAAVAIDGVLFVDGPFFDVLQMPFAYGDRTAALSRPGTVVLTESEALRRFGTGNPIGRTLTLSSWGKTLDYRVTGVVRDPPPNSHLSFNLVARFDPASFFADSPDILTNWGWLSGHVYLKLKPGARADSISAALPAWERRNIPDTVAEGARTNLGDSYEWRLVNVGDVHLSEAPMVAMRPGNDRRTIVTVGVLALLILGIACVNFVNLTTARATQRAREVALRKVLGARRTQLVGQFLGEAMLLTCIAMLIALALVELSLPALSQWLEAPLSVDYLGRGGLIGPIIGLVLTIGGLAGIYPALHLSRFAPGRILKANQSAPEAQGSGRLRTAMVVVQFAISIALITCTAIIYRQTIFARDSDPGYQREGILQISGMGNREAARVGETLINELRNLPGVTAVGRTSVAVATTNSANTMIHVPGRPEPVEIGNYPVDPGFFPAMGIDLVAGRTFGGAHATDDATIPYPTDPEAEAALARRGVNVVINARAARALGFSRPERAVGQQVRAALVDPAHGLVPATIVGVVGDSRFRSARDPIDPMMFRNSRSEHQYLVFRYEDADPQALRQRVERVWRRLVPEIPLEAAFSEDLVADLYRSEEAFGETFAAFAALAIVIACLGLFGLAAFTAERRTKEIGIRKVFGARTGDIVQLLAWQFSKPVVIANLIAWPVAWWVMRDWLNNFDARIDLGPTPFLLAGVLALAIALGTIAGHAIKVARANPIHALRYE
ncbi:MAG: ABC transporter permease [Pseudomonadota bacterium]|nr:ABC transporter permease [Pseudomonadota bacterium]